MAVGDWFGSQASALFGSVAKAICDALNINDGVTAGTLAASKVVTLDANSKLNLNAGGLVRTGYKFNASSRVKAGTTAGWTVGAANNLGTLGTVAASQTAATLVVYLDGLHVGDTITAFDVISSINSAGAAVTLDANLRSLTVAAGATGTDASIASATQVSVTAATASTSSTTGLSTVVAAGVQYYLLLTCTTGLGTSLELESVYVTVTTA